MWKESVAADKDISKSSWKTNLTHTRPDIGFAVSMASRSMSNLTETDMRDVNRILQYLKGTPGQGLYFLREVRNSLSWLGAVQKQNSELWHMVFVKEHGSSKC